MAGSTIDLGASREDIDMDIMLVFIGEWGWVVGQGVGVPGEGGPHHAMCNQSRGPRAGTSTADRLGSLNPPCHPPPPPLPVCCVAGAYLFTSCAYSIPMTGYAVINKWGSYITLCAFAAGYAVFLVLESLSEAGVFLSKGVGA